MEEAGEEFKTFNQYTKAAVRRLLAIYFPTYIKLQDVSRHCPSASPSGKALKAVYCRNAESPRLGAETQTTQPSLS
jgi:hypothetical protein